MGAHAHTIKEVNPQANTIDYDIHTKIRNDNGGP